MTILLHIELANIEPKVWRDFVVPSTTPLPVLHQIIQGVMGWQNCHLHEFQFGTARYGQPDPDELDAVRAERGVSLSEALGGLNSFRYLYDFGDDWQHKVTVKEVLPGKSGRKVPRCLAGENACPPEDVGGPWGYEAFLAAIQDPQHEEHSAMLDSHGGSFDPTTFDVDSINQQLTGRGQ